MIFILHCVLTTQHEIIFDHHILIHFTLYYIPSSLSSVNRHTVICVWTFVCFSCFFICFFQFYIPPMNEIIWFLTFLSSDLFYLAWCSQGLFMSPQVAVFHLFLWRSNTPLYVCTYHFLFIQSSVKGYAIYFYVLANLNNATKNIGVHISLEYFFNFIK